jgi:Zn-dependent protease with chaperone function
VYEQQFSFINDKIDVLVKKAKLRKKPKIVVSKTLAPASANGLLNRLYISKNFLAQWKEGIRDEQNVDSILAHEVGHLAEYQYNKTDAILRVLAVFFYFILLLGALASALALGWIFGILVSFILPIAILSVWIFFLPWILRKLLLLGELKADQYVLEFSLMEPHEFASAILKSLVLTPSGKLGPAKTIELLESRLTHPNIIQRLKNIGFELKQPIQIERTSKAEAKED